MYKDIMLCVDMQEEVSTTKALRVCIELCRSYSATLHVLTVVPEMGFAQVAQHFPKDAEEMIVNEAKSQLKALVKTDVPDDIKVQHIVAQGSVYDRIIGMSKRIAADLIVITAHRPELKDYLLGPNAARVVRHADCSVMVVR